MIGEGGNLADDQSKAGCQSDQFLLAEFTSLREEIHKRTEIQHQLMTLALVALGAFLSIEHMGASSALLAYPILALFLAAAWSHSDIRIRQIGAYIHACIERKFMGLDCGWEHHLRNVAGVGRFGSMAFFASRGVFVGTQVLAILCAIIRTEVPEDHLTLFVVDGAAVILTILVLKPHRPFAKQGQKVFLANHDA
jgi:hypothetical protein